MISHQYQCIFIHIPKCAGTSIEHALGHHDAYNGLDRQDHRTIRMIEHPWLTPAAFSSKANIAELLRRQRNQYFRRASNYKNKYTVTEEQYHSYFKFTIVRNPWSRAFSLYSKVSHDDVYRQGLKLEAGVSLADFLRRFAGQGLLRAQLDWIRAFDGSIPLDYIARFENLDNEVGVICDRLHIARLTLPHEVKGSGQDYREHYTEEAKRLVADTYKEEIELFGYSFDQ